MHALLLTAALLAANDPTPPTLRLPDNAQPVKYKVELSVDPTADKLSGAIDIELDVKKPTSVLWLNANELTITKSSADKVIAGGKDFVGLEFKKPLAVGAHKVHIEYTALLSTKDSDGASKQKEGDDWYVFTHFEPIDARRVFPCFDEPGYKVPWQVTLRVRPRDKAFSNTPQLAEKTEGEWKRVSFAETKPLPSYLLAFAVGPFDIVDGGKAKKSGTAIRILTPKGQGDRARWAAASSRESLDALEEYFGSNYPYEKLDCIAVPLFGGAMENPGLVTFSSQLILQKPDEETIDRKRAYAEVATHEFAHQWFGDLVTMAWWDDLWLNEAFATWMTPKIIETWQPTWGAAEERMFTRGRAMSSDSLISARKIRQPITSNDDMKNAFDGITYSKGATVIATFERFVGADAFRKGVQAYMKKHAHGNATAADFLGAISAEAKRDIAPAFSTFLDQPGVPIVALDLACDKTAKLKLKQQRYLPLGSPGGGEDQVWSIPVCVRTSNGNACTLLDKREGEIALGDKCPTWVAPNDGGNAYYRALPSTDLAKQLRTVALPSLSAPEKLGVISDFNALVRAGKLDLSALLELAPTLSQDKNRFVVESIAGSVGWLRESNLVSDAQRPAYVKYIQDVFGERARKLTWKEQPSEDEDTRLLRVEIVPLVAHSGMDKTLIAEAQKLAAAWLTDPKAVAPNVLDHVLSIAAENGDKALYEKWLNAAKAEKDREQRRRLLRAVASFRDPAIVKSTLPILLTDAFEVREAMSLLWGPTGSPETRPIVWDWVQGNFDALVKKLPRDNGAYLPFTATGLCDAALVPKVKAFFGERSKQFTGGPRQLDQALEQMQLCAVYKQAQAPVVAKFLSARK
ncbi:MAG: M1 family metallopeptidase [Deltaproteobacteria bacterium]|nr:M1 family metallopeptidase [Deltaproteobacteria bacterium]